jgi:predicted aconitase
MVNRETTPTALATALTGRTPLFGMHIPENRYGQVLVEVGDDLDPREFTNADYSAFSYYTGKVVMDRSPVFTGFPSDTTITQLKHLCAPLGVSGAVSLAHIVGVTPEAPTAEAAFLGRKPEEKIIVGKRELNRTYGDLCTATEEKVDAVVFGCPNATVEEIKGIAELLKGKKIHDGVRLLIGTPEPLRILAERMGLTDVVESAGGLVVSDMCPTVAVGILGPEIGVHVVASNCSKCAHYTTAFSSGKVKAWFGGARQCINAAMTGKWGGE